MLFDKELLLEDGTALTATRDSTNVIDLGAAARDVATGELVQMEFVVTTALASSGNAATLDITVINDTATNLSTSPTTVYAVPQIAEATLVQGYKINIKLPAHVLTKRYLGLILTVGTENFTSGAMEGGILCDHQTAQSDWTANTGF